MVNEIRTLLYDEKKNRRCLYGYGYCHAPAELEGYAFKLYCDECVVKELMQKKREMSPVGFS
jgi:hypothetical protein